VELWKSDGSAGGTVLVKDINPGSAGSNPASLTNVNGILYFAADDGTSGVELWQSDGTAAGTTLVMDIYPGRTGSYPANLTNSNGTLFFRADDGVHGQQPWVLPGVPTTPAAASLTVSGFPSSTTAGVPGSFTVTAKNTNGTTATGYTGTVYFSSSDGQAALPTEYTFVPGDAGVHTFSAILKTAGTQSLTATDTTTPTPTGSEAGIAVTPTAASQLVVTTPASSMAGSPFSVTLTARDPYNNLATAYTGSVHFTSSDGQASLPGDYTFASGDAGVHTFANGVILKTAGSQTVTARDTVTSSMTGNAAVTVSPAAASTLILAGFPSATTAGAAGNFTVTLKDLYGNIASGYTGTVHFTSSDAKAALPANYTFTAADAGVHIFSATLKTAGTQSITATDTTTGSLTSTDGGITVKPASASKFIISAPASVTAGVAFSLTVTVQDAYGNVVTGYTGTIHFTSTDNRATLPANYTFTASDRGVHTFTGLVLQKKNTQKITLTDTLNSALTGSVIVDVR
jgi:ELWxxDGT repeat protein